MKTPHKFLRALPLVMATGLLSTLQGCSSGKASMTVSGGSGSLGTYQITAWGDSLTQGDEDSSGISFPNQLAKMTGQTVNNLGVGAQTSSQIAVRINAYAGQPEQTFAAGFTLPTSGTVSVTFQTGFEPVNAQYRPAYPNGVPLSFTVAGQTWTGNVIQTGTSDVFTPAAYPPAPVAVPAGTAWTVVIPAEVSSGCMVIWAGRGNYLNSARVQEDIAAMVAALQQSTSCYLVMSIPNGEYPFEWKGTEDYNKIVALDNALSATYSPGNHYLDIRSALVALYNPNNPADVMDHNNDVPPYSLRAQNMPGSLTSPIASPATCSFTVDPAQTAGRIISLDAELILIAGGTDGDYICTRGFAGTAPETYASGTAMTGVNAIHPGQNSQSSLNPKYTNGFVAVAAQVYAWLQANGPK